MAGIEVAKGEGMEAVNQASESVSKELLPCPFCGGEARFFEHDDSGFAYDIKCGTHDCWMQYGGDWYFDKDWAAKRWNKRAA